MFSGRLTSFSLSILGIIYSMDNISGWSAPQQLLCGDVNAYNPSTHVCVNDTVVPVSNLTCGDSFQKYNLETHECVNDKIIARSRTPSCGLTNTDRKLRLKCCGNLSYNPGFQTCCHSNGGQKYELHDGKQEEKHVCCNLKAYKRTSPKAACHVSALNDRLFRAKALVKGNQKLCKEDLFVHMIEVEGRTKKGRNLKVRVSMWRWKPSKSIRLLRSKPLKEKKMRVRLDENSPQKDLSGKLLLVFSSLRYTDGNGKLLRLRYGDRIYRFPKNNVGQRKVLTRMRVKCKQYELRHS